MCVHHCCWPGDQRGVHCCCHGDFRVPQEVPGSQRKFRASDSESAAPQTAGPAPRPGRAPSPGHTDAGGRRLSGEAGDSRLQSAHPASDGCDSGCAQVEMYKLQQNDNRHKKWVDHNLKESKQNKENWAAITVHSQQPSGQITCLKGLKE